VKVDRRKQGGIDLTIRTINDGVLTCKHSGYRVEIKSTYNGAWNGRSADISSFTYAKIIPRKRQSLDWYVEQLFNVRDFAAMCFGLPLPLRYIELTPDGRSKPPQRDRHTVRLFFRDHRSYINERRSSEYPILPLQAICQTNGDALSSWIECKDRFQQTIDLIFVLFYTEFLHVEIRFLLMMQAFEAFDRNGFPRKLITDGAFQDVYKAMMGAIPRGLPSAIRQKMDSSIKYANEPSLRQRLRHYHGLLSEELGENPFGFDMRRINKMVNTRNYYTHYPETFSEEMLTFLEMYEEADRFCVLLILSILHQMGFDMTTLRNRTSYHSRFRRFIGTA